MPITRAKSLEKAGFIKCNPPKFFTFFLNLLIYIIFGLVFAILKNISILYFLLVESLLGLFA